MNIFCGRGGSSEFGQKAPGGGGGAAKEGNSDEGGGTTGDKERGAILSPSSAWFIVRNGVEVVG